MADDKFSDEVKKELKGFNETVEKNTKKFGKSMSTVINKMAEVNAPLAAQLSDVRAASKDSFAGALQTKKAVELTSKLTQMQAGNVEMTADELGKLNEVFEKYGEGNFDFKSFSGISNKVNTTLKELEELEDIRAEELAKRQSSSSKLGKLQADIDKQEKLMADDSFAKGAIYQNALAKRDKLQTEIDAKEKQLLKKEDEAIAAKKEQLEEERKTAAELSGQVEKVNASLQEDGGRFGQFSDGLKTLTGFDIAGMADDVVSNINAVGKLFGSENLFGSIMESFQSIDLSGIKDSLGGMIGSVSGSMGKMSKGIMKRMSIMSTAVSGFFTTMATSVMTGLATAGAAIMTGLGAIGGALMTAGGMLMTGAGIVWTSITSFFTGLMGVMSRLLAAGLRMLAAIPMLIVNAAMFIAGLISTAASLLVAALPFIAIGILIIGAIVGLIMAFNYMYENVEWFRNGIDWIAEKFWQVYQFLADMGVFDAIKTYIGDIFSSITGIFTGVIDFIKAALSGDFGGMWDAVKGIFSSIKDLFLAPFKFVKNLILGEDPEGLDEAAESGLYDIDRIGNSEIDEDKVKGAPMKHLKAIVAHDDLSDDDMALIKEEIARQEAVNLAAGGEPTTGQEVALGTQEIAGAGAGGGVTVINQVNDNSQNSNATNVHGGSGKTTNSDSTAGRVANNVE